MAYSSSVNISIETQAENIIQEISYDGQEIYQPALSMSDNLSKLAQKIDFSKIDEDTKQPEIEIKSEEECKDQSLNVPISGWIDSVVSKLKRAATEICVISDVLAVTKEKRYMILDPIPIESIETKPMAQIYLRKKALASASNIIMSAVERLRSSQNEFMRNRTTPDFHIELLRLRQNWRLKKVSTAIIGDLSYKTAGSKFGQSGMFEVTKAEDDIQSTCGISSNSPSSSPSHNVSITKSPSALRVTVPTELQGVSYIMVLCQKDQENIFNTSFNLLGSAPATPNPDMHWQQKLEAAQNVLFCKELFNQLAKEAVQLQATIPHMVVGNQISATVFPGIQLIIGLCHSSTNGNPNTILPSKTDHDHVLEHSLHQLLREVHHRNTHQPFPHPSSGPLGPSKRRAVAGPNAADRLELLEMSKSQTLLEQIIEQAQHFFMRLRTEYVIDTLAKEVKDPIIISHWNSLNSPTQACVKVTIVSHGFDCICRTSLVVHVMKKSLKCICRDGRVMYLSYEPQELRDLIFCQIYQHQIMGVQSVAKTQGWQFLASSSHLGLGPVEPMGNASSCLLASPIGDRLISVKCEPQGNVSVSIAHSPKKDFFGGQLVKERKWENLGGSFKKVRWDKMEEVLMNNALKKPRFSFFEYLLLSTHFSNSNCTLCVGVHYKMGPALMLLSPIRKILVSQSKTICCTTIHFNGLLHPDNNYSMTSKRYAFTDIISIQTKSRIYDLLNRFLILNPLKKAKYQASSWILYETIVDQIPFDDILKKLNLPDTFNSWFIITELHLWMIFVRLMHEGTNGSMIRNYIVEALWNDVEFRSKKLGHANSDIRHTQIIELSDQLRAALIGYDEGWLSNDIVLASMVWRRIFNKKCNDPEKIEMVVKYIRKQMSIFQLQTFDSLFLKKDVKLIKFV